MPAKGSDNLFQLIKSLTSSEKRHFRNFAERHVIGEKNNYLKLFDDIDRMGIYDEKKLKTKKYLSQLPRQKNYLQHRILKSLQSFFADDTKENEVENYIQQIRILFKKGQIELCEKLIEKTKTICFGQELFLEKIKVLKLERALLKRTGMIYHEKYFTPLNNEIIDLLEHEKNGVEYFHLQNKFFSKMYNNGLSQIKGDQKFEDLMHHPLLKNEKLATGLYSKCIFTNIYVVYYRVTHNYPKYYKYSKKFADLKKKEYLITNNSTEYVAGLHNYFLACIQNKRFTECNSILNELGSLPSKSQGEEGIITGMYLNLKVELFIYTSKFSEGASFIEKVKTKFEKVAPYMNPIIRTTTIYYCFQILFLNKDFRKSLHWMQLLMEEDPKAQRPGVFVHVQIQNLMVHYELRNFEVLPYLIKSAHRYLKKTKQFGEFERTMIAFFDSIVRNEKQIHSSAKIALESLLLVFKNKEYKKSTLQYFDYLAWLESKSKS